MVGVALSTTVLTGALIVGDSVRGSLGNLAEIRLGKIRWAMQPNDRFFRAKLAKELSEETGISVVPVLQVVGIGINPESGRRIQNIQVSGVNTTFAALWDGPPVLPGKGEVVISKNLAERLSLAAGDPFLVRLPKRGTAPQNTPFVAEETPSVAMRLTVKDITDDRNMGRFNLKNNQSAPFNVFIPLAELTFRLEIPGLANLLLMPEIEPERVVSDMPGSIVANAWRPADAGIVIDTLDEKGELQITSDRIFFDDHSAEVIRDALPDPERS